MKKLLLISMLFSACYTETRKPDYVFMNRIKQQASLDSTLKTTIELHPRKYFFRGKKGQEIFTGFFYITNVGSINFNALSIKSNCECITTKYETTTIKPHDSLKVNYEVDIKNQTGFISNSIIALGNCQFGNQTYYIEGTIINK